MDKKSLPNSKWLTSIPVSHKRWFRLSFDKIWNKITRFWFKIFWFDAVTSIDSTLGVETFANRNFHEFREFWSNSRKFMLAKTFYKANSRKFMFAKCKNFANFPTRESFSSRKFLRLNYVWDDFQQLNFSNWICFNNVLLSNIFYTRLIQGCI